VELLLYELKSKGFAIGRTISDTRTSSDSVQEGSFDESFPTRLPEWDGLDASRIEGDGKDIRFCWDGNLAKKAVECIKQASATTCKGSLERLSLAVKRSWKKNDARKRSAA